MRLMRITFHRELKSEILDWMQLYCLESTQGSNKTSPPITFVALYDNKPPE